MYGRYLQDTLDAERFQFLERCIATIKKLGVRAEASGLEDSSPAWSRYIEFATLNS
jgi:hypothetical protein